MDGYILHTFETGLDGNWRNTGTPERVMKVYIWVPETEEEAVTWIEKTTNLFVMNLTVE